MTESEKGMVMELHEMRYFTALSKVLNFTRAADNCNVTQPALTRAIQKMEAEFGGLLVSRERGNTHLTALGRTLEPYFEKILAHVEDVRRVAARFGRLEDARLTIGVEDGIGATPFASFLSRFCDLHPGIAISVATAGPSPIRAMLVTGDIDVALMVGASGSDPQLAKNRLYRERFMLACRTDHEFAGRAVLRGDDLGDQVYLQRSGCDYFDRLRAALQPRGVTLTPTLCAGCDDWTQTMVAAGLGVQFLPEYSAIVPGLVLRRVVDPEITRDVCVTTVAGRRWSPPVAALVKAIRVHAWPGPPSTIPPAYADHHDRALAVASRCPHVGVA